MAAETIPEPPKISLTAWVIATAGAGNDQQRCQVANKHGQNMLPAQENCLLQRHLSVQLEGFFRQFVRLLRRAGVEPKIVSKAESLLVK